jgi:crotonobetainyl-CoA:carnitine CoA-transferase CaiB-like acyl-CoA transferase
MTPTVVQPLRGLVVLEEGNDLALAFCGKYLAALGADVHLASGHRLMQQSNWVRAYVDDGKLPSSVAAKNADIVLTTDPHLPLPHGTIRVLVTDNGDAGPQAEWVGGELIAQASSGLAHLVGEPGRAPLQLGGHQIDYSTGLMAFTGVMIALTARTLHPQQPVQEVQVSRLEAAAYIEWKGRTYHQSGTEFSRGELSGPIVIRCRDGHFGLYYRTMDWPNVLSVLDAPELLNPPFDTQAGRIKHRRELADAISALCADAAVSDLYQRLQSAGVPAGPVMDAAALLDSEQYRHRDFFVPNPIAGDGALQPAIPVQFNGVRPVRKDLAS